MSTEANREAIRRAFITWRDEGAPIADVFAPEMTWRIEGRSVVAGDYANRQQFTIGCWRRSARVRRGRAMQARSHPCDLRR
jgi:hypothetical protein